MKGNAVHAAAGTRGHYALDVEMAVYRRGQMMGRRVGANDTAVVPARVDFVHPPDPHAAEARDRAQGRVWLGVKGKCPRVCRAVGEHDALRAQAGGGWRGGEGAAGRMRASTAQEGNRPTVGVVYVQCTCLHRYSVTFQAAAQAPAPGSVWRLRVQQGVTRTR